MCQRCKEYMEGVKPEVLEVLSKHKDRIDALAAEIGTEISEIMMRVDPVDPAAIPSEDEKEGIRQAKIYAGLAAAVHYASNMACHNDTYESIVDFLSNGGATIGRNHHGAILADRVLN